MSFSSNDISDGSLYKKLDFKLDKVNKASYWYIKQGSFERFHRLTLTKDAIIKKGWADSKEGWKESDVLKRHGYIQIYDSGVQKWIWRSETF